MFFVSHFLLHSRGLGQKITPESCSTPRKTLRMSKISSKIDFYSQISALWNRSRLFCWKVWILTQKHGLYTNFRAPPDGGSQPSSSKKTTFLSRKFFIVHQFSFLYDYFKAKKWLIHVKNLRQIVWRFLNKSEDEGTKQKSHSLRFFSIVA
jgi:hypothetical protein